MSDSNPYAAPQTLVEPSFTASSGDGDPQPWEIGQAISFGFDAFKLHWAPLLGSIVVGYVILMAVQLVMQGIVGAAIGTGITPGGQIDYGIFAASIAVTTLVSLVAQSAVMPGWMRLFLMAARGETPQFGAFFSAFGLFPSMLGAMLLNVLAVYAGMLLLIIPGLVVGMGFMLHGFFVADGEKAIDSLKKSWAATDGQRLALFGFVLVLGLLNVGGALLCGIGMLVTIPVSFVAWAWVYTRITGRTAPRGWA